MHTYSFLSAIIHFTSLSHLKKRDKKEEEEKNDTKMKHPQIVTCKKLGEELF